MIIESFKLLLKTVKDHSEVLDRKDIPISLFRLIIQESFYDESDNELAQQVIKHYNNTLKNLYNECLAKCKKENNDYIEVEYIEGRINAIGDFYKYGNNKRRRYRK